MTQEEKDLLLKDLCSRLPYGVKVKFKVNEVIESREEIIYNKEDGEYSYITDRKSYLTLDIIKMIFNNYLDDIKPYLFPLSSMTEEQEMEFKGLLSEVYDFSFRMEELLEFIQSQKDIPFRFIDWLIKNNFDYRGLIPMGLAIDATNLNIY
jgi:hypothetical protein